VKKTSFTKLLVVVASLMMVAGTAMAQWDGGAASNNNDGGNDQGTNDHTTYSDSTDSSTDSNGWDGGSATNNDDGSSSDQSWDGGSASNNDDGSSSSNEWDGGSAENNDDGASTDWNGGTSTNNDDGGDGGTEWDGGSADNNDDAPSSDDDSSDDSTQNTGDTEDTSSSGSGESSDFSWPDIGVVGPVSFQLSPSPAEAGETVTVTGQAGDTAGEDVEIMLDGTLVAQTETTPGGDFETSFTISEASQHTVAVEAAGTSAEKVLQVNPSVDVANIRATQLNSGGTTRVCADVQSQTTPTVRLVENGATLDTETQTGDVCLTAQLSDGTHTLQLIAEAEGRSDSAQTAVTVDTANTQPATTENTGNSNTILASILQPLVQAFATIVQMMASIVPV
jgi:hypothetical protein